MRESVKGGVAPARRRLKAAATAAGFLALAMVAAGCAPGGTTASSEKNEITVAIATAPLSLDPAKNGNTADNQLVMSLAYEPLIHLDGDGELSPGLATDWGYTDETLTTFQLTLRDDAKFSDGTHVTAEAVVASIQHEKEANGPVAVYVNAIAEAIAVDEQTVELKLAQPNPTIALTLTQRFLIGQIVAPAGSADPDRLGTETLGAGPYVLDSANTVSNDHYVFVPNEHYYDQDAIHFDKFTVRVIPNAQTAFNALKSGQVSYIGGSFSAAEQAQSANLDVYSALSAWYAIFLFDRNGEVVPALGDHKVRQALNYAIDREAIVTTLFDEYGEPNAETSIPGYEDSGFVPDYVDFYPYDPEKAKKLLQEAGYGDGFSMTIGATEGFGNGVLVTQAVADYWKAIGVDVNIQSYNAIPDIVGPWQAKELPAVAGYYDAQPMFVQAGQALVKDAGLFNPFESEDAELTELINTAYATTDEAQVPEAWAAVQRRVVELGWFVPFASGANLYFASPDLQGVELSPTAFVPDPTKFHF